MAQKVVNRGSKYKKCNGPYFKKNEIMEGGYLYEEIEYNGIQQWEWEDWKPVGVQVAKNYGVLHYIGELLLALPSRQV